MQQWEYAEIEVTIADAGQSFKAEALIYHADGNHESAKGKPGELYARFGLDGWELVASTARTGAGLTGHHKINHLFKRPLFQRETVP